MSSPKRYHPGKEVAEHPAVQMAFTTLGALLMATNGKDMECDFAMEDKKTGKMRQFHLDISVVDNG